MFVKLNLFRQRVVEKKYMKKRLKYTLLSLGSIIAVAAVVLTVMFVVRHSKVKRLLRRAASISNVFVDRLKGKPYSKSDYDGIDVSNNNGFIRWKKVAQDQRIKYVYIKATEGNGYVDPRYRQNVRGARKAGLKVGSYHFLTSRSSATAQFLHFQSVAKKSEQDLLPVLDIEEQGIKGGWKGQQLVDSVKVFAKLVKKHYGKYPVIYCNEHFYNKELDAQFNRYYLFIANYNNVAPDVDGKGKCNIWQYTERGHLRGIGEYVDLSRFLNGTTIDDLTL